MLKAIELREEDAIEMYFTATLLKEKGENEDSQE